MKWSGLIGFKGDPVEVEPGVWDPKPKVITYPYFGEIQSLSWREQQSDKINADLHVSNKLSVVADQNLMTNFHMIAYVTFGGAKWTVSDVTVEGRRLILQLGSLYLEETDED